MSTTYEPVIGLEVHAELMTESKIFCSCSTAFGAQPNTQTCPVCLGFPGVLPVINRKALGLAMRAALALNCQVSHRYFFERKNYFYPDLPKAYQISQKKIPLGQEGLLDIQLKDQIKPIRIREVHLEEDTGKLFHAGDALTGTVSLIDYNRSGIPLLEIVTEPDLRSTEEVEAYMISLREILLYAGVSDCKMEEGRLRFEANVSVRLSGTTDYNTRTEVKNLNSFKSVLGAITAELKRQEESMRRGERVLAQTMLYDEVRGVTEPMRSKEESHDYRYFPEPDLVPVEVDEDWMTKLKASLPELPQQKRQRFVADFGLPEYDAAFLTRSMAMADYFESVARDSGQPKAASNWIMGDLLRLLNLANLDISESPLRPQQLVQLLQLIDQGTISGKIAKSVFEEMFQTGRNAGDLVQEKGLTQIRDEDQLTSLINKVIDENPKVVAEFKAGKEKSIGFLVGQVMKQTQGKANPQLVNDLLKKQLM